MFCGGVFKMPEIAWRIIFIFIVIILFSFHKQVSKKHKKTGDTADANFKEDFEKMIQDIQTSVAKSKRYVIQCVHITTPFKWYHFNRKIWC